jgi:dipeptidyl aminopeptidase/acylaminoacyl peptidase
MRTLKVSATLIASAAVLGLGLFVAVSSASVEDGDGRIAYAVGGGEDPYFIRTIRSDGTYDRRLLGPRRRRFFRGPSGPQWSPDGKKLLFGGHLHLDTDAQSLWYSTASGKHITRIPLGLGEGGPEEAPERVTLHGWDWAPGGRRVVFAARKGLAPPTLYTISLDGRHRRALHEGWWPEWSSDGRHILFTIPSPDPYRSYCRAQIAVVRPSGTHFRPLTDSSHDASPRFSPNGRRVLFVRHPCNARMRWRIVDVTGRHDRAVGPKRPWKLAYCAPQWTPDGTRLAAVRFDHGSKRDRIVPRLVTMKASGANKRVVFAFPERPSWYYQGSGICDFTWQPR